jgi:hypothetical protein
LLKKQNFSEEQTLTFPADYANIRGLLKNQNLSALIRNIRGKLFREKERFP